MTSVGISCFGAAAFAFRFAMLAVSVRHERVLRAEGAVEHGAPVSRLLATAHVAYYVAAAVEGLERAPPFGAVAAVGLALYLFGAVMLLVVARLLGRLWTVKVLIAPDHALVRHPLFRKFRHPNYYLNIAPELLGFGLVLHAFATMSVGLPIYLVLLALRIRGEEAAMRGRFSRY